MGIDAEFFLLGGKGGGGGGGGGVVMDDMYTVKNGIVNITTKCMVVKSCHSSD